MYENRYSVDEPAMLNAWEYCVSRVELGHELTRSVGDAAVRWARQMDLEAEWESHLRDIRDLLHRENVAATILPGDLGVQAQLCVPIIQSVAQSLDLSYLTTTDAPWEEVAQYGDYLLYAPEDYADHKPFHHFLAVVRVSPGGMLGASWDDSPISYMATEGLSLRADTANPFTVSTIILSTLRIRGGF